MSGTPPTSPAARVRAVKTISRQPTELRDAAMTLFGELGAERHTLRDDRTRNNKKFGERAHRLALLGDNYGHIATTVGIPRNTVARLGGPVENGTVKPKRGEEDRVRAEVETLGAEWRRIDTALTDNSEAMAELTRWLHVELSVPKKYIADQAGLSRSSVYDWLEPPKKARKKTTTGRRKTPRKGTE